MSCRTIKSLIPGNWDVDVKQMQFAAGRYKLTTSVPDCTCNCLSPLHSGNEPPMRFVFVSFAILDNAVRDSLGMLGKVLRSVWTVLYLI